MITNDNGDVALVYYQSVRKYVRLGDGTEYVFMPQRTISLAWIQERHVGQILAKTKQCCGGSKKTVFRYATEQQERIWSGRSER